MKNFFSVGFDWLQDHWRGLASTLIVATLAVLTLSLQIDLVLPGQNKFETATLTSINDTVIPWNNPVNAPYNVTAFIVGKLVDNPLQGARMVSVLFGLLATACLFYVLKKWFNIRMATVGSLLFITSSWLLHISHIATPFILMIFAPLACLAAFSWLIRTKKYKIFAILTFVATLAFSAYVPYMFWILLATLVVLFYQSWDKIKAIESWQWVAGCTLYLVLIAPLLFGMLAEPTTAKQLLGIPQQLPSFNGYIHNLINLVMAPFFRSPLLPETHLGRLPLLDVFSTTMFILGIYYYAQRLTNRRTLILFGSLFLLLFVIPLSGGYLLNATILMPLIYICIITGIVELLKQWFSYFPRNPLARGLGVAFVVIAIGFTSFYHLQRYFIAWPNTPDTKAVYVVKSNE
jgi:hypothetical protein